MFRALDGDAVTVRVVLAPLAPGVGEDGEKVAVTPAGRSEILKVMGELKGLEALADATSKIRLAEEPRCTVRAAAVGAVRVKSGDVGATPLPVSATVCVPASSVTVSVPVAAPATVGANWIRNTQVPGCDNGQGFGAEVGELKPGPLTL